MEGSALNAAAGTGNIPYPSSSSKKSKRVSDNASAYTVQCAKCSKWRYIPTKEKYGEIRETIAELPFLCETAREWRPDITCEEKPDFVQDGSWNWATDKPSIPRPPPDWKRILRIRPRGGTRFADFYYDAPSGKRLRSMQEVQSYLYEHSEPGVSLSQFLFQIPEPLEENYVRKHRTSSAILNDTSGAVVPVGGEGNSTSDAEAPAESRGWCLNYRQSSCRHQC